MIIFGSRTTQRIIAALFFVCTFCNAEAAQRLVRVRSMFTLFFIPVFPFGHGQYMISCAYCGNQTALSRASAEEFQRDAVELEAARMNAETAVPEIPSA
ncbi:zinc-ribbon domain-containing protein [Mycetocola lacteus]|uniref:Zinc-ribbon domain-containing protein n=1 Tax=Mycetocola lacteus TaxID=76637 RepID=A0A3L7APH1_9MICO|nr:zinc-ribbon domain-containing protein [Mycetocola lacteus]RLP82326.1 zinc-ribbon domain-containing protein [Mycetocola lacteus]